LWAWKGGSKMEKVFPFEVVFPKPQLVASRVADSFEYVNNQKTNRVIGVTLTTVNVASKDFEKVPIKVEGTDNCPVTQAMINDSDERIYVNLINGTCRFYVDRNNNLAVSVRADKITIVPAKK